MTDKAVIYHFTSDGIKRIEAIKKEAVEWTEQHFALKKSKATQKEGQ